GRVRRARGCSDCGAAIRGNALRRVGSLRNDRRWREKSACGNDHAVVNLRSSGCEWRRRREFCSRREGADREIQNSDGGAIVKDVGWFFCSRFAVRSVERERGRSLTPPAERRLQKTVLFRF